MNTLTVVLAIIGAVSVSLFLLVLVGVFALVLVRKRAAKRATESAEVTEDAEDDQYTLEALMEQSNGPTFMAVSLHELFRTFRAAGFTQEEAYGLVQNALYASILANSE